MTRLDRLVELVTNRSKTVIAILLVLTLVVGAGAPNIEETTQMELFDEEPQELEKRAYVQDEFTSHEGNTTQLVVVVRNESGNVLSRDSLLESLRYQQSLRENATVDGTLAGNQGAFGIENVVATAALRQDGGPSPQASGPGATPPLSAQIRALESASDQQVGQLVARLLDPDSAGETGGTERALDLLPASYEPGTTTAEKRLLVVTQETAQLVVSPPELSEEVRDAQVAAATIADDTSRDEYRLTGPGLMVVEEQASMGDSLQLVGPVALLFVLITLAFAYRDLLDLGLGLVGIVLVLTWTFGAMGWLGIDFSLMMIAVPVLLIGLSIDYCIHVVMRYRENRAGNGVSGAVEADGGSTPRDSVVAAMRDGLVGLGPALALVTVTAMIGFLSIRTSGVPVLAAFGVATAVGIVAALVIFGTLVPALKVELDEFLADRGYDRTTRAFGTTGRMRALLAGIARVSFRRPLAIILLALLVSSVGLVAGTQLDTQFSTDDYVAEEAPDWAQELPGGLAPSDYELRETNQYLYANFQSPDQQVHVVVEGNVTNAETLQRVAAAERDAANRSVVFTRPTGDPSVSGAVGAMHAVADTNGTFASLLSTADTDDDGVPDENVSAVLDGFYRAAPDRADQVLDRADDGEYEGLQIEVVVDGTVAPTTVASELREVGDVVRGADDASETSGETADDGDGTPGSIDDVTVTVTGDTVINQMVQKQLATTLVQGLTIALVAVLVVLVVAFRLTRSSASLGVVTVLPVLLGLSWILGAMYLAGIPFSFATAIIGSIAIGLGVDYAIHVSERYSHELDRHGDVETALEESVVGTGGALLGSAITTASGFGVLAFALVPTMQQFGVIIALTLVAAFVASVLVLPSLLVVWTRYSHPV